MAQGRKERVCRCRMRDVFNVFLGGLGGSRGSKEHGM